MATIPLASYLPLQDGETTVTGAAPLLLDIDVPQQHVSGPSSRDVLQFRVDTRNANDLRFVAELRHDIPLGESGPSDFTNQFNYGPSDTNLTRDFAEIVRDVIDGHNQLRFRITGGSGTLIISDVILWYRVNMPL